MENLEGKIVKVELKDGSGWVKGYCVGHGANHIDVIHPYHQQFSIDESLIEVTHDQRPIVITADMDDDIRADSSSPAKELIEYNWCIGGYAMQIDGITCGTVMASDAKKAEHLARTNAYKGYDKLFELFGEAVHADINGGLELYLESDRIL